MYTHFYDLICKAIALVVPLFLMIALTPLGKGKGVSSVWLTSMFVIVAALWWFLMRPISSWLYARLSLRTCLSWAQAKRASVLFSPVRDFSNWLPSKDVRSLPEDKRVGALMERADSLIECHETKASLWRNSPVTLRIYRVLSWLLILGGIVAALGNFPPFHLMTGIQEQIFDGSYYPFLNVFVGVIPGAIWLNILTRKVETRTVITQVTPIADQQEESDSLGESDDVVDSVESNMDRWMPPSHM